MADLNDEDQMDRTTTGDRGNLGLPFEINPPAAATGNAPESTPPVVERVPPEVLAHIFSYTVSQDEPYEWAEVTSVCRKWYFAAAEHATLWTDIRLPEITSEAFLERSIKLSRSAMLRVTLKFYPYLRGTLEWDELPAPRIRSLLKMVFQQLHRTKSLILDCRNIATMLDALEDDNPQITLNQLLGIGVQGVQATDSSDVVLPLDHRVAPALETLILENGRDIRLENIALLSTLRSLSLSFHRDDPEPLALRLRNCLQSLPLLESCTLSYYNNMTTEQTSPLSLHKRCELLPEMYLRNIRKFSLRLGSRVFSYVLMSRLRLPADAILYIDAQYCSIKSRDELDEVMKPIISRFLSPYPPPPLRALSISFSDALAATLMGWKNAISLPAGHKDPTGLSFKICSNRPDAYTFYPKEMVSTLPIDQVTLLIADMRYGRGRAANCCADLGGLAPSVTELRIQQEKYPQQDIGYLCKLVRIGTSITSPFPRLDILELHGCIMEDNDADHLRRVLEWRTGRGCAQLRRLKLVNAKLSEECLSRLKAFIPKVDKIAVENESGTKS